MSAVHEHQLSVGDALSIAEHVLSVPGEKLRIVARLGQLESALAAPYAGFGDQVFYPDPVQRAAILCSRLVRNHPLPDGNKRTAYYAMLMTLDKTGHTFEHPANDQDVTASKIEALAARDLSEEDFVAFIQANTLP